MGGRGRGRGGEREGAGVRRGAVVWGGGARDVERECGETERASRERR